MAKYLPAALLAIPVFSTLLAPAAWAQPGSFQANSLRVEKITNRAGRVTINGTPVKAGATGLAGETVATSKTKAEVFFPNTAQGVLGLNSQLLLGSCIRLQPNGSGKAGVLVSGKKCISIGKPGRASSTVVVELDEENVYTVAVLAGKFVVGESEATSELNYNILDQFPSIATTFGVGGSGYGNAYPASGGLIIGSANTFIPLAQHRAKSILYSYTTTGSNFDGYWGATTEVGYRWFTPANRAATSVYVGYSGFDSPSCFSNLINLGAGWEKGRWRLGASSGFSMGGCDASFSFGALNISAPIGNVDGLHPAYLGLTPYILWGGTIPSPTNYEGSGTSVSPGVKLTATVPVGDRVSVSAYGAVDTVFGASVGGLFKLRFPTGGGMIHDPNLTGQQATAQDSGPSPGTGPQRPPDAAPPPGEGDLVVNESYRARFTAEGKQIGETVKMTPGEIIGYITEYLDGISPLAEGHRIAKVASKNRALTTKVSAILGSQFLEVASLPASETAQQPFDINFFPTAPYACVATAEGKAYAERRLRADNKNSLADQVAAADVVYLGTGEKVSNGWPITTTTADAFRFGNGATCSKINSLIRDDRNYDGPSNPVETVVLN